MSANPTATPTPEPTPPARRLILALLVAVPWLLLLFQLVVVVPRYAKLFAEFGLKLSDLTQVAIDVAAWTNEYPTLALVLGGSVIALSMLLVYRASANLKDQRRWWLLFFVYAIPTAAFLVVWLGVAGPHAKIEEGLRK
jgi:type II secretory pathway component PulF